MKNLDDKTSTNEIDKLLIKTLGNIINNETDRLECRTKALVALGSVTNRLENVQVVEEVLPIFKNKIFECDSSAALAMCVNGILLIMPPRWTN